MPLEQKKEQPQAAEIGPKCQACAQKNRVARFNHHWFLDRENGKLADHLLEQYGADYETDGRLTRRLELVREADRLFRSVEAVKYGWGLGDAYYEALKRVGLLRSCVKSGTELAQPKEDRL